jgi:hypothetical protein
MGAKLSLRMRIGNWEFVRLIRQFLMLRAAALALRVLMLRAAALALRVSISNSHPRHLAEHLRQATRTL